MVSQHIGNPFALHHINTNQALHRRVLPDRCLKAHAQFLRVSDVMKCVRVLTGKDTTMMNLTPTIMVTAMVTMVALARARSVQSSDTPSVATESSHLLFYLTVEKELVPQTEDLADRAFHLFQIQCGAFYNKTSTCLTEAEKLPGIPALKDFPSDASLQREGSKVFTKHLLKDVHTNLFKLQILLEAEEDGFQPLTDLITEMRNTREQLETEMDSFYQVNLRGYDSFKTVEKSKERYMRQSRSSAGICQTEDDDDCLTEGEYYLRLLYTAYKRLLRINHVLDYTVRLSWLAIEDDTWP